MMREIAMSLDFARHVEDSQSRISRVSVLGASVSGDMTEKISIVRQPSRCEVEATISTPMARTANGDTVPRHTRIDEPGTAGDTTRRPQGTS